MPGAVFGTTVTFELGVRFQARFAGSIDAIWFVKAADSTAGKTTLTTRSLSSSHLRLFPDRQCSLWTTSGALLARGVLPGASTGGALTWQRCRLDTSVAIAANVQHVASFWNSGPFFRASPSPFAADTITRGSLVLVNARDGLYATSATPTFPNIAINATYFVDVEFVAEPSTPIPTPAPATPSPTPHPSPSPVPGSTPSPMPEPTPAPTPSQGPSETQTQQTASTVGTTSGPSTASPSMTTVDGGLIEKSSGTSSGLLSSPAGTDNSAVLIPAIVVPIAVVALLAAIGVAVCIAKKSKTQGSGGDHATVLQPHYAPSPVADSGTVVGNYGPSPLTEGKYDRVPPATDATDYGAPPAVAYAHAGSDASNYDYDAPPAVAR
jgi:hypothetical protein